MKKRLIIFILTLVLLVCIIRFAVPQKGKPEFTAGICQFTQHDSLDAATQGFQDALTNRLGDRIAFEVQNANGDFTVCTAAVNDLISKNVDLILANSTSSLQAAANATTEIPILGTAVTEYDTILQADGSDITAAKNISGASDLVPPDEQAAMVQELFPDKNTIGMIYCSSESNSQYQVDALQARLAEMGYACRSYLFVDSSDLSSVTMTAASECDILYIPTDNTVASNAGLIANICIPDKIPVLAGDESTCRICGVATLSVNYYDLGYATGEMAAQILADGKDISELPIQYASSFTKKYNEEICAQLGVSVPEDYIALETR